MSRLFLLKKILYNFEMLRGYGSKDILQALKNINLPIYLAKSDVRQRYRRSTLGPFWITLSTGIMIASIGLIFGNIFKSPMEEFLPFLASGLIFWSFISTVIIDSTTVFTRSEAIIKQLPLPLFSHVERLIARNSLILLHNLIILPVVYLVLHKGVNWFVLLSIFGYILLISNLAWMSLLIGIICTRYRDLVQIVTSLLQVVFYVTPIIWMPELLPERASAMVLEANPFFHFLQVVRVPLLGGCPSLSNWIFTFSICIIGWVITLIIFNKYKHRIAYWL